MDCLPNSRSSAKAVGQRPDAGDRYQDLISRLEKARRIEADPDPGRRAGGDEIARLQGEPCRNRCHQRGDIEDEVASIAILPKLAVHPAFHGEIRCIELVGRRDPGTHRAKGVEPLPQEPLLVIALPIARGYIVDNGVAPDVVVGMLGCDVAPRLPDYYGELGLVIDRRGDVAMEVDRVAVADDGSRWLGEHGGVLVDLCSLHSAGLIAAPCELLRMLAIILADAEDVSPRGDRGQKLDPVQRNPRPIDQPEPTDFVVSLDEIDHVVHGWIERADARRVHTDGT